MNKFRLTKQVFLIGFFFLNCLNLLSQTEKPSYKLPGKGLKQHPFLYVGEWDTRHPEAQSMYVVRNGKVVWQYSIPLRTLTGGIQEFDDATMLNNGNIVYACMSGAGIITPQKNIIWQYICSPGTETHSCQPIGKDSVLLVVNGIPAKLLIINTKVNKILHEIIVPTASTKPHVQFRHARMTRNNTFMVGLKHEKKVVELDINGNIIWSVDADSPWAAVRLTNGNTLISGDALAYTREVNMKGETVWEITQDDVPFKLYNNQTANRLANGNTVISNWCAGNKKTEEWANTVQVFEITPDKKVVWALSAWDKPDLGPNTYIQLLDETGNPEKVELQR